MKRKSKADRQFEDDQKWARRLVLAEPMLLMRCLIRRTLIREALALEEQLTHLGLNYHERTAVYKELSVRREALEAELFTPGAYDRLIAEAAVTGLLSRPVPAIPGEAIVPPYPAKGEQATP